MKVELAIVKFIMSFRCVIIFVFILIVNANAYFIVNDTDILCDEETIIENKSYQKMEVFVGHPWTNVLFKFITEIPNYDFELYKTSCNALLMNATIIQKRLKKELGHCFKNDLTFKKSLMIDHIVQIFRYLCTFHETQKLGKIIFHNLCVVIKS